jgi:hypothetical protein
VSWFSFPPPYTSFLHPFPLVFFLLSYRLPFAQFLSGMTQMYMQIGPLFRWSVRNI